MSEKCFCGSGLEQSQCHPDIHKDSVIAKTYNLYNRLDNAVNEYFQKNDIEPYCRAGCSYCCHDFFFISDIEFDIIIKELEGWSKNKVNRLFQKVESSWKKFEKKYPMVVHDFQVQKFTSTQLMNELDRADIINKTSIPCPFLDKEDKCSIYNVRPFICRSFGTTKITIDLGVVNYNICELINTQGQYDKNKFAEATSLSDESKDLVDTIFDARTNGRHYKRGATILYHAYRHFIRYKQGFNILNHDYKFNKPIGEYFRYMASKIGK